MQVTVLMPIYNAEKYLRDAIDSLLCQTSKDWKLICIDDGSIDSSTKIVEEYCNKDCRISLIKQANAGPALARARAIENVDTEYVSILDSDDAYAPNYIELMLKRAEETDADSVVPDVEFGYGNTTKLPNAFAQHHLSADMIINDGHSAFAMTIPWKLHGWQMIKTSLAKRYYTVEAASYSKFNSDEYITRLLYLKSMRVALCSAIYKYRIADDSITRTPSLKKLDYLKTIDKLLDLCITEKIGHEVMLELYNQYSMILISMSQLLKRLPQSDQSVGKRLIKEAYYNSYRRKFDATILGIASMKTKMKFRLSMISVYIFKILSW